MQFANIRYCYIQRAVAAACLANLDTVINCFIRSGSSLPDTMLEAHLLSAVHDFLSVYLQLLVLYVPGLFPGGKAGRSVVLTTYPFSASSSVGSTIPLSPSVSAWLVTGQPLPLPLPCLPSAN